jgi:cytochrome b561
VDKDKSTLGFSGMHAGKPFQGVFERWDARIRFDPDDLKASAVEVSVDTQSARTGDAMVDGALPTPDWFDVKTHPQAHFISDAISAREEGGYRAEGRLTLRGATHPVAFDFTLSDLAAPPVTTRFSLELDRVAFGIGMKSDGKAEWVSQKIAIQVSLSAHPK